MELTLFAIGDLNRFYTYQIEKSKWNSTQRILYDKIIPLVLFSVSGALGWAIRGTGGYGGSFGGALVGLLWGILFYFLASIRGIDARWATFFLGIGIAFGGTNGYGQQLSWIRGEFSAGTNTTLPIDPMIGYIWLLIIGFNWGGTATVMLTWALSAFPDKKQRTKIWIYRLFGGIIGGVIAFLIVSSLPQVFYPNYSPELYESIECGKHCARTIETLPKLAMLLGITIGLLITELAITKDKRVLSLTLLGAVGFSFAFPICANWWFVSEFTQSVSYDWWKMWEESIGLFGGLGLGSVFLLIMKYQEQPFQKRIAANIPKDELIKEITPLNVKKDWNAHRIHVFCLVLLFIVSFIGGSENAGFSIGYDTVSNDNAGFPLSRIILTLVVLIPALIYCLIQYRKDKQQSHSGNILFTRPEQFNRWIYWGTMVAFWGIIAIACNHPMLHYLLYYWVILIVSLRLNSFLKRFNLEI